MMIPGADEFICGVFGLIAGLFAMVQRLEWEALDEKVEVMG